MNAPKTALTFGPPEKKNRGKAILAWGFVVLGIAGIAWMIYASPHQRNLNCDLNARPSLLTFGSCVEE